MDRNGSASLRNRTDTTRLRAVRGAFRRALTAVDGRQRPVTTRRIPLTVALSVVLLAAAGVAGAATVAGSGSPLAAAQVSADQHRLEITNDGSAETAYEASFDAVVGTGGFGSGDAVDGNAASGFVRGGTDTILYTGDVTGFSFEGPAPTVRVDGTEVPVSDLVDEPSAEPEEHRIEITNDGSGRTEYAVTVGGVVGTDGLGSGDGVDGNTASGFVRGGTDAVVYTGDVTDFSYSGVAPTVRIDGSVVSADQLAADGAASGDGSGDQSGDGSDGDGTDGDGSDDGSTADECLPNPYDFAEEDTYTRGEYEMGMPDRFVEDIIATDGVEAFYYGYEGPQAGAAWLVTTEAGAEPVVYCKANSVDTEGIILADWRYSGTYTDAYGDTDFTPAAARWTADPTYERDMAISDQSVDWLLEQDHVQRVEKTRTCDRSGCGEGVTVYLETHPLDQDEWWKQLPDRIDGVDVNYAEA